jgi:hypothetical protein
VPSLNPWRPRITVLAPGVGPSPARLSAARPLMEVASASRSLCLTVQIALIVIPAREAWRRAARRCAWVQRLQRPEGLRAPTQPG